MWAIRLFIAEGEESGSEASAVQERQEGRPAGGEGKRTSVTYQPSEQASPLLRGDEFAKQLRLARHLAASSLPLSRPLEPHLEARTRKEARSVTKARRQSQSRTQFMRYSAIDCGQRARETAELGAGGYHGN
jgi:hypothetical protein